MFTIVGYKFMKFNDESGKEIAGFKICFLSNNDDPDLDEGQLAFNKFFTSKSITGTVQIGAVCDFKISMSGNTPKISGLDIKEI